jgi:DNA-binding transcriptional MerR regulator
MEHKFPLEPDLRSYLKILTGAMDAKIQDKEWLSAAACASRTGLTVRALRVYEREGLLNPGRSANGWRRYGSSDLVRLNTIVILKGFGLTLSAVMRDHSPPVLRMLELQANAWKEKIAGAQRALACVEAARHRLQCRHDLSIDDLCGLIKTLDESGSLGMESATSIMRDLINEVAYRMSRPSASMRSIRYSQSPLLAGRRPSPPTGLVLSKPRSVQPPLERHPLQCQDTAQCSRATGQPADSSCAGKSA